MNGALPKDKTGPTTVRTQRAVSLGPSRSRARPSREKRSNTTQKAHPLHILSFSPSKGSYFTGGSSASHGQLFFKASSFRALMKMAFDFPNLLFQRPASNFGSWASHLIGAGQRTGAAPSSLQTWPRRQPVEPRRSPIEAARPP